ncbi:MAG: hypothetical protein KDE51_04705 [Anaerolineales bacterium]|nr:hypothetical protein [Anaerolineales bacterium]
MALRNVGAYRPLLFAAALLIAFLFTLSNLSKASAAVITVETTAGTYDASLACAVITIADLGPASGGDNLTSLREAICAANNTAGADTITLATGMVYTLDEIDNTADGANGLPSITSDLILQGNGSTIARNVSSGNAFRILHVRGDASLVLENVTIRNGVANGSGDAGRGGGIFSSGTTQLIDTVVMSNTAAVSGGGIYNGGAQTGYIGGLIAGSLTGNMSLSANPENGGIVLSPEAGLTNQFPPWAGNTTWVYTGQFYDADGVFSFAERVDDQTLVVIDGTTVLSDIVWNVATTSGVLNMGMGPNGDGWHDIEIRFSNGGGGAGAVNGGGWTTTKGFGLNVDGSSSTDGSNYISPVDPGDGSLFRTTVDLTSALSLELTNSQVLSNTAQRGGGIDNTGSLVMTNGSVAYNSVTADGGGLVNGNTAVLDGTVLMQNHAAVEGGAILNRGYSAGLLAGSISGTSISFAENPGDSGFMLGPEAAFTRLAPPWAANVTWVYTGQFYDADGVFSFAENIDDYAWVSIDGTTILNNGVWNAPTTSGVYTAGMGINNDGWHEIEIRLWNGGLPGGPVAGNGWTTTKGLGLHVDGSTSTQGGDYIEPIDPGDGSLFRVQNNVAITLTNVTINDNQAADGAGLFNAGMVNATGAALSGNRATQHGGGFYNEQDLMLNNVTVSGNTAVDGAGLYNMSSVNISDSNFGNNDASGNGGAIQNGGYMAGLVAGAIYTTGISLADNPADQGIVLSPEAAATTASPPWANNTTWVYTGEFYDADGVFSFAENLDDYAWVAIDGTVVLNNGVWNVATTSDVLNMGMGVNGDGWHTIEIRLYNGNGGAGPVSTNGWDATKGLGLNIDGSSSNQGGDYIFPIDPGDGSLFRTAVSNVAITITNTTLDNNTAVLGAGVYSLGDLSITGSTLSSNQASGSGGAIYNGGDLELLIATISGNSAQANGGGLSNVNNATLINVTITDNQAPNGAGLFNIATAVPGLAAGTLAGNYSLAANPLNQGVMLSPEAAYSQAFPPWANNTTWVYTGQFYDADGIFSFAESLDDKARIEIDGVVILDDAVWNVAAISGVYDAGMGANGDGWHEIEIRLSNGGGLAGPSTGTGWPANMGLGFNKDGSNSGLFTDYVVALDPGDGSLFRVITNGDYALNLQNSIVAGNIGDDCAGLMSSLGHNLNGDSSCGLSAAGDLSNSDPLLGVLANNGGSTLTHLPQPGSPVADAADDAAATCALNDQRGQARIDIIGVGASICDIGAVEGLFTIVQFDVTAMQFNEDGLTAAVVVSRTGTVDNVASALVSLSGGSATAGADYDGTPFPVTVNFAIGQMTQTVTIDIYSDIEIEGTETISLTVSNVVNADLGTQLDTVVEILDTAVDLANLSGSHVDAGHSLSSNYLGSDVTADAAAGADVNDGVAIIASERWLADDTVHLDITVTGSGFVAGWIDWNDNGVFESGNEFVVAQSFTAGTTQVTLTIPSGYTPPLTALDARFRLYDNQPITPAPDGFAAGGEVEDYSWAFSVLAVTMQPPQAIGNDYDALPLTIGMVFMLSTLTWVVAFRNRKPKQF